MPGRRDDVRELLRQRVVNGLHLGLFAHGDRLPSARATAEELAVDYRLVVAAYRELQREGLVEVRPRSGIFVSPEEAPAGGGELPRPARRMVDVLVEEVMAGRPAPEFPERVRRSLETLRLRAACLECNEDQLVGLSSELERDYGFECDGFDVAELSVDGRQPIELRRADVLVTTGFHAAETRALAERLGKPWIAVTLDPGLRAELLRLLASGPVYWVIADPRFADKLRLLFPPEDGGGSLRPLVVGRDEGRTIAEGAPVLVMTAAARRDPDSPLVRRGRSLRGFSAETARQILTFVVERNMAAAGAATAEGGYRALGEREAAGSAKARTNRQVASEAP